MVIISQREGNGNEESLKGALFGDEEWLVSPSIQEMTIQRTLDGFFGSPGRPRNRHVSAVLYKRRLRDVWSISNQWTAYDTSTGTPYPPPDWTLVHHPEAVNPLPVGIFPFAVEYVWYSETPERINATKTLNSTLGLPDYWPGGEH